MRKLKTNMTKHCIIGIVALHSSADLEYLSGNEKEVATKQQQANRQNPGRFLKGNKNCGNGNAIGFAPAGWTTLEREDFDNMKVKKKAKATHRGKKRVSKGSTEK